MWMSNFLIFNLLTLVVCIKEALTWDYDINGSNEWPNFFAQCGYGRKQSPIMISKDDTICNRNIKPISIENKETIKKFNFTNTR